MAYATLAQVKAAMQKTNTDGDVVITRILDAATRSIDRFCNRLDDGFIADLTASARYYSGDGRSFLLIDECVAITEVAVKDSASDTDYTAWTTPTTMMAGDGDWLPFSGDPKAPNFNDLPYDSLMIDPNGDYATFTSGLYAGRRGFRPTQSYGRSVPTVRTTARWGFSIAVPDDIQEACIMQSIIWYKRQQGAMASALASPELGVIELYRTLDPAVELILRMGRYIKPATGRR